MFRVFDSFDTDETFHPFPPMWPLRVILKPGNSFELQTAVLARVSRNEENYFRFVDERHGLLHGARGCDRLSPFNSDPFYNGIREK